ncbi:RNA ligase family protein [Pseudomonas soli]|nr:RNA ligase family protein [Pseudomonas soli]MDT3716704.1 RNA ligase family protein [Pseudomonas soli]MDT3733545.1 RNA ligase family protein [Pseudomonas soli]
MNMDFRADAHSLELLKYPRTAHLQGSRLQDGDSDAGQVAYGSLVGQWLVVEEKLDGANAGISFTNGGELRLQSRGHYLSGGGRERQFYHAEGDVWVHTRLVVEALLAQSAYRDASAEQRFVLFGAACCMTSQSPTPR